MICIMFVISEKDVNAGIGCSFSAVKLLNYINIVSINHFSVRMVQGLFGIRLFPINFLVLQTGGRLAYLLPCIVFR